MASDEYSYEGKAEDPEKADVTENEDGSVTVQLTPQAEDMPEEAFNLVPHFAGTEDGKKFLTEVTTKVMEDFQEDWDSCEPWRVKRKTRWRLFVGDLDPKTYPWEDCANVHIPVMLERVLRVTHRMYSEMFPEKDLIFQALPVNSLTQERADILTLHDNWQFRKEIPDFLKQNRRALMEFIIHGDCVMHSSRDIAGKRNRHEALNCEEVVFPYHFKTSMTDMSDVPRKTRILRKYKHELLDLEEAGTFFGVTEMLEKKDKDPSFQDGPDPTVRPVVDKHEGREQPTKSTAAPYTLYEYHGRCKLPGQKRERPIVAIVSPKCKEILALYLREQDDWKDRARFKAQQEEFDLYTQNQQTFAGLQAQEQQVMARLQMPDVPPEEAQALQQALSAQKAEPPPVPTWLKEGMTGPTPVRKIPIESFSHGVCIENLDGALGLGLGLLLEPFNMAANTAASQFTDSATLANVVTGLVPQNVRMDGGDVVLTPGTMARVSGVSPENIQNAIKLVQFPPANPQLMDIVRLMLESADGVSSAPDVLSGEAGKANETYAGIATRVEQATKQLTVLAQNFLEMLDNVVKANARLNSVFMEDVELKSVIDPRTLESQQLEVSRSLYLEDFSITFTADTRFGGRQAKIAELDQLMGMVMSMPPQILGALFPPSFIYELTTRMLKVRGFHDLIRFLGPRPPTPTGPPMAGPPGMPPPGMPPGGPPQGPPQPQQGPPAPPPQ